MNIKKISVVLLAALLACTVVGCNNDNSDTSEDDAETKEEALVYENFTYDVNGEGTYEITGYLYGGTELQDVVIPSQIPPKEGGREVTGIAKDAFKAIKTIKSVSIPESITYIDQYAFYDCDMLTEIKIPNSVTSIGVGAFENCDKLAKVTLSDKLTAIADNTFRYCEALDGVVLPEGLVSIGSAAFWYCTSLKEITVPEGVRDLGDGAFYGCASLEKATVLGTLLGVDEINEELDEDDEDRVIKHTIGTVVFKSCLPDENNGKTMTEITVTKDSAFARYVEEEGYLNVKIVDPEAQA